MPAACTRLLVAPSSLRWAVQAKTPQGIPAVTHVPACKEVLGYRRRPSSDLNGVLGHCSRINWHLCSLSTWDGLAHYFFALLDQSLLTLQVNFYPSLPKYFKHIYKNKPNLLPIFQLSGLMTSRTQTTDLSTDPTYKSGLSRYRQLITPAAGIPTLLRLCCMWLAWKMKLNLYNRSNLIHDLELQPSYSKLICMPATLYLYE